MTWLPGASVVDLSGSRGNGPFQTCLGVVLHVNDDENGTSDDFYRTNVKQVTPNFQVYKDGTVHQYLPINWQPWCQVNGNFNYAAIETAGLPGEPLTAAQIAACGRILAAYHAELGVQLVTAEQPSQPGLGWHGMGGADWGGHTSCPGDIRKAQRAAILQAAAGADPSPSPTPITGEDDMFVIFGYKGAIFVSPISYAFKRGFKNMDALKKWEAQAKVLGAKFYLEPAMDPAEAAYIPTGATVA